MTGYPDFTCPKCKTEICMSCHQEKHSPLSCDGTCPFVRSLMLDYRRNPKLVARHVVEEARQRAAVRHCKNCGKSFEKMDGCNHVKCSCGVYQCYLCSQTLDSSLSHFKGSGGTCELYGVPKIAEEVHEAEAKAIRELLQKDPQLRASDLRI